MPTVVLVGTLDTKGQEYAYLADRYVLLPHGASFGDGYGPCVVAREEAGERVRDAEDAKRSWERSDETERERSLEQARARRATLKPLLVNGPIRSAKRGGYSELPNSLFVPSHSVSSVMFRTVFAPP